jgi:hypothetical protein
MERSQALAAQARVGQVLEAAASTAPLPGR